MKESMESKIAPGEVYEAEFSFTQDDVVAFAKVTGDNNPIHLDEDYASKTPFKRRIVHGFLGGSVFSKVFGTQYPGEGTIYLKQSMIFLKPMYTDTRYTAKFTVTETFPEKKRASVKTEILNPEGDTVITGEALIMHQGIV